MNTGLIKTIVVILFLLLPIFAIQSNFQKINPYDPNWIYGDDIVSVNKDFYKWTKDKNLYFTYLLYNWNIKFAESAWNNVEKYLLREETSKFINDMIELWDSPSFHRLYDNISAIILFNLELTPWLRSEYANQIFSKLQSLKEREKQSEHATVYKKYLEKEFEYCQEYWLPLNPLYSNLYWGLWVSDRLYNKNYKRAFCSFLYSGYQTKKLAYSEQLLALSTQIEDDFFDKDYINSLWTRLKDYALYEALLKEKTHTDWADIYIEDNGALAKRIRDINNAMRDSNNSYHINKIINEEE